MPVVVPFASRFVSAFRRRAALPHAARRGFSRACLLRHGVSLLFLVPSAALPVWAQTSTGDDTPRASLKPPVAQLLLVRPITRLVKGGGAKRDARSLDPLRVGDSIAVGDTKGSTADLVFYATGTRYQMAAGSEIVIQAGTLRVVKGPTPKPLPALDRRLLRPIADAQNQNKRIGPQFGGQVIRGGLGKSVPTDFLVPAASPAFLTPSDVTVRWQKGERTPVRVTVSVFRLPAAVGGSSSAAVPVGGPITVESALGQMTLPSSTFAPGGRYRVVFGDGPVPPFVIVRILTAAERKDVEGMARDLRKLPRAASDDPTPELMTALLFESRDLLENARAAYADALRRNPSDVTAAHWLKMYVP